uniref:Uncharacterized protein n=1 Tax=Gallus gallus TaxID=9031 RepID=A0A8V0Z9W0_CHICK
AKDLRDGEGCVDVFPPLAGLGDEQHREHPDAHTDKLHPVPLLGGSAGGVDDGQVAVHTDASQQQDAAVEVGFLQHRDGFAHDGAKNPLVGPVDGPERQAEGKEQVGHSQVEQITTWGHRVPPGSGVPYVDLGLRYAELSLHPLPR